MNTTRTLLHEDIRRLQGILDYISDVLRWVTEESELIPKNIRDGFRDALPEVRDSIKAVRSQLDDVEEGDERWEQLSAVGMTGSQLKMKIGVLGYLTGLKAPLKRILAWINSVLGSLASIFPGLDIAKEYKEQVELVVEHQHGDGPTPGVQPILDLR